MYQALGLKVLVYEALGSSLRLFQPVSSSFGSLYWRQQGIVRPQALQEYEALGYSCMRPYAASVCGLELRVYEALCC